MAQTEQSAGGCSVLPCQLLEQLAEEYLQLAKTSNALRQEEIENLSVALCGAKRLRSDCDTRYRHLQLGKRLKQSCGDVNVFVALSNDIVSQILVWTRDKTLLQLSMVNKQLRGMVAQRLPKKELKTSRQLTLNQIVDAVQWLSPDLSLFDRRVLHIHHLMKKHLKNSANLVAICAHKFDTIVVEDWFGSTRVKLSEDVDYLSKCLKKCVWPNSCARFIWQRCGLHLWEGGSVWRLLPNPCIFYWSMIISLDWACVSRMPNVIRDDMVHDCRPGWVCSNLRLELRDILDIDRLLRFFRSVEACFSYVYIHSLCLSYKPSLKEARLSSEMFREKLKQCLKQLCALHGHMFELKNTPIQVLSNLNKHLNKRRVFNVTRSFGSYEERGTGSFMKTIWSDEDVPRLVDGEGLVFGKE